MNQYKQQILTRILSLVLLGMGLVPGIGLGKSNFGSQIDNHCSGSNPYADQGCSLCHAGSNYGQRVDPEWTWWSNGSTHPNGWDNFCTSEVPNQAPNGTILQPTSRTITAGDSLLFQGDGSDSDNNIPLSYRWTFQSAGGNLPDRTGASVTVSFPNEGVYSVRLTVTDSLGLSDPSPPSRTITVVPPTPTCNDADDDGFATDGGACGPVDCNDSDPAIHPNATENCNDGVDNNCDGLIDSADPAAIGCAGCADADQDLFSPEGGVCGPVDCDDQNPSVNPAATEICDDSVDNDCDFYLDDTDSECDGTDCIGRLSAGLPLSFNLRFSLETDRDPWQPLNGAVVAGDIFVFVPADPDIVQVRFFLDGLHTQTENIVPWDFAGGNSAAANPFDTGTISDGNHWIEAEIDLAWGVTDVVAADFKVGNDVPSIVDITSAVWNPQANELRVSGYWPQVGDTVTVSDAATGAAIGNTSVEWENGAAQWAFTGTLAPNGVPCRVRVTLDSVSAERDVDNAPANCGGAGIGVRITQAIWDADDRKLLVEGNQAPGKATVTLKDANTSAVLGTKQAEDDGKWKFEVEDPAQAPCRIRVEAAGTFEEQDVTGAPTSCRPPPSGPPTPCTGEDLALQGVSFTESGTCTGTRSLRAEQTVLEPAVIVEFVSPQVSLGAGFEVKGGAVFRAGRP